MSNYVKSTDFAGKDALNSGDAAKIVKGTEIGAEFDAIQTAVNSKANANNAALTGVPTAPTAALATDTTQIATTAFVLANTPPTPTYVLTAGSIVTTGGWNVTPTGATLYFNYNGTNVAKLDSSGNLTTLANITAYGSI